MKKEYKKPILAVESFQLNAAIAGSCSNGIPINHYEDNCGHGTATEPGFTWEFFGDLHCVTDVTLSGGDGNDGVCYHGPSDSDEKVFVWS